MKVEIGLWPTDKGKTQQVETGFMISYGEFGDMYECRNKS